MDNLQLLEDTLELLKNKDVPEVDKEILKNLMKMELAITHIINILETN